MLPVTEELSDYQSEQANEISPCSELNPFLNMFHVRKFPTQALQNKVQLSCILNQQT